MQKKINSYAFWVTLLGAVFALLVQILRIFKIYLGSETISNLTSGILGVLVACGLISMPKKDENLDNDKKDDNSSKEE